MIRRIFKPKRQIPTPPPLLPEHIRRHIEAQKAGVFCPWRNRKTRTERTENDR
jgi:hypothetical protein